MFKLQIKIAYIVLILSSFVQYASMIEYNPLLAIVIMVKNEEAAMLPTLKPFLDAKLQHFLILDTGSTDNTVEVTRQIFIDYQVEYGYVEQAGWVDYATSRNVAIAVAEEKFPQAAFFLMIDAEWYMENVEGLLQFCCQKVLQPELAYLLLLKTQTARNYTCRLFKPHRGLKFIGAVHECLSYASMSAMPEDIFVVWGPNRYGQEKTQQRWYRDLKILHREYEKNKYDPRTVFYLAQTYHWLELMHEAEYWYEQRCKLAGWYEENFVARYHLACVQEALGNWDKALVNYIKAYNMRPCRIEPLVKLAQHYLALHDFATTSMLARQAVETKPHTDFLFVEQIFYDFTRYDLLGIAAWYTGQYDIGEMAVLKALQYWPDGKHLLFNLSLYKSKKESI